MDFKDDTVIEVSFQDGQVIQYDMAVLYDKYPQLRALEDRTLFLSGKLRGNYGIVWNDELDIETETIYQEGTTVRKIKTFSASGEAVLNARAKKELTQKQLADITGIDQSDISKIERGVINPTIGTLERIAEGLGGQLKIRIDLNE